MKDLDRAVRFQHPEKSASMQRVGAGAVDLTPVIAGAYGVAPEIVERTRRRMRAEVEHSVDGMLRRAEITTAVKRLPFESGQTIVALGDSITDDLLSWAHQLEALLSLAMPDRDVIVVNAGFSGDTSADIIGRLDTVLDHRPAWVLQLVGTNDARRHGVDERQVFSGGETARNLETIRRIICVDGRARLVRMTPPPVLDERIGRYPEFLAERLSWRSEEVRQIACDLRSSDHAIIDLHGRMMSDASVLIGDDGVHPTLAGQRVILEEVLFGIAS